MPFDENHKTWMSKVSSVDLINAAFDFTLEDKYNDLQEEYKSSTTEVATKKDRLESVRSGFTDEFKYDLQRTLQDIKWTNGLSLLAEPSKTWAIEEELDTGHDRIGEGLTGLEEADIRKKFEKIHDQANLMAGEIHKKHWKEIADHVGPSDEGGAYNDTKLGEMAEKYWVDKDTIKRVIEAYGDPAAGEVITYGDPPFTEEEIRNELYGPLMREGIIPDNLIPDKYNETVTQFKGSSDLYQDELQRRSEKMGKHDETLSSIEDAQFYMDKGTKLVTQINSLCGGPSGVALTADLVNVFSQLFAEGAKMKLSAKNFDTAGDAFGKCVGAVVAAATGSQDMKSLVQYAISGSVKIGLGIKELVKDPYSEENVLNAVDYFADAVYDSLSIASGCVSDDGQSTALGNWATGLKHAIKRSADAKRIHTALKNNDSAAVIKIITGALAEAATDTAQSFVNAEDKSANALEAYYGTTELTEDQQLARASATKDDIAGHIGDFSVILGGKEVALVVNNEKLTETLKEQETLAKEKERLAKEATDKEINTEIQKLKDMTIDELIGDEKSIDQLIADIVKDQLIMKAAEGIIMTATKTAAEFVPAVGIAVAGMEFLKQLTLAAARQQQLIEWREANRKALVAAAAQGYAFANRVLNLEVQRNEALRQMTYAAAKVVGNSLTVSGIFAPVGVAVTGTATATSIVDEIVSRGVAKAKMENAWKMYLDALKKCALGSATDRKLILKCFENNPTLAKYSMYYAATKMNDVIAKEGLKLAGLSEKVVLDADASKVVTYLELLWDQDPQCYKRVAPKKDWMTDNSYTLTHEYFVINKLSAEDPEKGNMTGLAPTDLIQGMLVAFENAEKEARKADSAYENARNGYASLCLELKPAGEQKKSDSLPLPKPVDSRPSNQFVTTNTSKCDEIVRLRDSELESAEGDVSLQNQAKKKFVKGIDKLFEALAKEKKVHQNRIDFAGGVKTSYDKWKTASDEMTNLIKKRQEKSKAAAEATNYLITALSNYKPGNEEFADFVGCLESVAKTQGSEFSNFSAASKTLAADVEQNKEDVESLKTDVDSFNTDAPTDKSGLKDLETKLKKSIEGEYNTLLTGMINNPDASLSTLKVDKEQVIADGESAIEATVTVKNEKGNPLANKTVELTVGGSDNTVGASKKTDPSGVAKISFTTTKAESKQVSAQAESTPITETQTVTAKPGT